MLAWIGQAMRGAGEPPVTFDQLVGCSVGAINTGFLAGEAGSLEGSSRALWEHWRTTEVGAVFRLRLRRLWRVPRALLGGGDPPRGPIALLDDGPLQDMVRRRIRWSGIGASLRSGPLRSIAWVATDLAGATPTVFHQDGPGRPAPRSTSDRRFVRGPLRPEHLLASMALPLLFPPVALDGHWYLDGGLSEQAPVRTALLLGARRVLSLNLDAPRPVTVDHRAPPTWPRVIGKTMNAVLLDRAEPEEERMARVNHLLAWGEGEYGPGFAEGLDRAMERDGGAPWQRTEALSLRPSMDLGELAGRAMARGLRGRVDEMTRVVFRFLEDTADAGDADALSFLLFDPSYLGSLLELGWEDAAARGDELREFLA